MCSSSLQVDAGIAQDLVFGDPKAPRFVFWNKKLRPTPSGPDVLTFDLLSIWGKIRAGLGAAGIKKALPGERRSLALQHHASCRATSASAWALQALRTTEAYATPLLEGEVAENVFECRAREADSLYIAVNEDCLESPAAGIHLCSRLGFE